ncbi:MAG TPA: acyltransferase [Steroidobacteraceae bacterium]|nr:acyltransferase [Steroidobacteraceae bacterium]
MSGAEIAMPAEIGLQRVESANSEATKVRDYAAFDLLRFTLAFAVLLSHTGILTWQQAGNLAVQVFFALSGWLIGSILCRTGRGELSRFYFNRATRIWIPYFVTVCILYAVSFAHQQSLSSRWHEFLIYDLTFTHNWFSLLPNAHIALSQMPLDGTGNHFWSIAVEEQFYLCAPLLMTLLPFGRSIYLWIAVAVTAIATGGWYGSVALGVLCAVIAQTFPGWHLSKAGRAALVVIVAASSLTMGMRGTDYVYGAPFFAAAVVLLCALPMRRTRATQWFGGVSYPLYLNAWIGIFAFHAIGKRYAIPEGWYYQTMLVLTAVVAAAVFYQLIDRNIMANRSRFYSRRLGWTLGALAYTLAATGILYGRYEIGQRAR